jgi:hypothetical protein
MSASVAAAQAALLADLKSFVARLEAGFPTPVVARPDLNPRLLRRHYSREPRPS